MVLQSLKALSSTLAQIGCTTDQMTQALRNISDLMAQMSWASDEIINELRPDTDAKTENPNQKSDLEIFDRIIPSEEFLKLEGNMFIN